MDMWCLTNKMEMKSVAGLYECNNYAYFDSFYINNYIN